MCFHPRNNAAHGSHQRRQHAGHTVLVPQQHIAAGSSKCTTLQRAPHTWGGQEQNACTHALSHAPRKQVGSACGDDDSPQLCSHNRIVMGRVSRVHFVGSMKWSVWGGVLSGRIRLCARTWASVRGRGAGRSTALSSAAHTASHPGVVSRFGGPRGTGVESTGVASGQRGDKRQCRQEPLRRWQVDTARHRYATAAATSKGHTLHN